MIDLYHFKPFERAGVKYFKGTLALFGVKAALCQLSPLLNLICHWRDIIGPWQK